MQKTTFLLAHLLARHACLRAALGLLAAPAFGPPPAQAAVTEAWVHRYSNVVSNSNDQAVKVVRDAAGNIIVTGFSDDGTSGQDMLIIKYSGVDGSVLWQQRYNGPANSDDRAMAVAVDGSGNVVVTGSSTGTNGYYEYYTTKYAAAGGALLWQKRGPGGVASAVAVDGGDNVVVTGSSATIKYAAADGALLWEKRYTNVSASAVAVDGSGNIVVTESSDGDYYTVKYAATDGALLWEKRYNGPANNTDEAKAIALDGNGNVVVTGYSWGGANGYDYYTAKYAAANGALLWEQRYNGPWISIDQAQAIAIDGSGNVVVTGSSAGTNAWDYYTAKYAAADGTLLWEQRYDGPANSYDYAQAVAVDGSGNVLVTGSSNNGGPNYYNDYYTAKYAAADGALLWEKRYNGPLNNGDHARAVAVDGSGNVVVTGVSDVFFSDNCDFPRGDYYTAKYAAADGALLWEKRYNGPADDRDVARSVVADGSGNVVVTGISNNGAPNYDSDFYTAKYAAADGTLLWEKRYNAAARNTYMDERVGGSHSLALGPNGMVAITGTSSGDYATVVYRDDVYPISIALIPTGIRLRFIGIPGRSYTIERAPAVTGPWTTFATPTAPLDGLVEYVDTNAPVRTAFYRTVQP